MVESHEQRRLDRALVGGVIWGLLIGALLALVRGPRLRVQPPTLPALDEVRDKLATVAPRDPVAESIAEGKAAARRRLTTLNPPQ